MKKFYLIGAIMVLFLSLTLTGCSLFQEQPAKPPNPPPGNPTNQNGQNQPPETPNPAGEPTNNQAASNLNKYFPITEGSTWDYAGEGMEYAAFIREILFTKDNLTQMKEDNSGTILASVYRVTDEAITQIYFQGEAYEDENFLDSQANDNTVIMKTPLAVGTKWTNARDVREIVDLNATVATPAGNFENCLKIKVTYNESKATSYDYYKEGVGLIKREYHSDGYLVTSILQSYNVK